MPECERLPGCPFFNNGIESGDSDYVERMKIRYCLGDYPECARYIVFLEFGPGTIPNDLLPDQVDEARKYIEELG